MYPTIEGVVGAFCEFNIWMISLYNTDLYLTILYWDLTVL